MLNATIADVKSARANSFRPWIPIAAIALLGAQIGYSRAQPQRVDVNPARKRPQKKPTLTEMYAAIDASAPVANLFERAEEGMARSDWKFAIDSLQRIIDNPERSLVAREDGPAPNLLYESARRRATRRLASMPPDGIATYRLLFDGRAKGLLERGMASHDAAQLREVVEHYPITSYADDAADVLASWALDEGRPGEAVALIEDVLAFLPDCDVPETLLIAKLAIAYAALGRDEDRRRVISAHVEHGGAADWLSDLSESTIVTGSPPAGATPDSAWPMSGGSASRAGRMAPADPLMNSTATWGYEWPERERVPFEVEVADHGSGLLLLPSEQVVADEERLYVRTYNGCAALSAEHLNLEWEAPNTEDLAELGLWRMVPDFTGAIQSTSTSADLDEEIAGMIAVQSGTVYTIEKDIAQPGRQLSNFRGFRIGPARTSFTASRIVARHGGTGVTLWQTGLQGPDDLLSGVDFRAVPLEVEGALWAPYLKQRDLHVAVLDPASGTLRHSVLLCTLQGSVDRERPLPLTHGDGRVFVPTGDGVLMAVSSSDHTPLWASVYATGAIHHGHHLDDAKAVLSSPAVLAGGLVLLLPTDADELIAFDASSGQIKWRSQPDHRMYIIAANERQVWLGGRGLSCVKIQDGTTQWSVTSSAPMTGRAVLCGNRLFLPTEAGLASYDANSGLPLDEDGKGPSLAQRPPAVAMCLNDSLYALDSLGARRFPDMERMYPQTAAAHQARPSDVMVTLRLARLELLRGESDGAVALLSGLARRALEPRDAERVAEARVEALLAQARQPGASHAVIMQRYADAFKTAQDARSRVRTGLAVADYLTEAERFGEALEQLWDLGLSPDSAGLTPWSDGVRVSMRTDLARRVQELLPKADAAARAGLEARLSDKLALAKAADDEGDGLEARDVMRAAMELSPGGVIGTSAALSLAESFFRQQRFELAELALRFCARHAESPEVGVKSLLRVYALLQVPSIRSPSAALQVIEELSTRFAAQPLPALEDSPLPGLDYVPGTLAGSWAAEILAASVAPKSTGPIELTGVRLWSIEPDPPQQQQQQQRAITSLRNDLMAPQLAVRDGAPLGERVLFVDPSEEALTAVSLMDRTALWSAKLRVPETWSDAVLYRVPAGLSFRVVLTGQVAVAAMPGGLHGVGVLTGKRLWSRALEAREESGKGSPEAPPVAEGNGMVFAVPRVGRLSAFRIGTGALVWERDLRGEPVDRLQVVSDFLLISDARSQRVGVYSSESGRFVRQILFAQPDAQNDPIPPVVSRGVLCGPDRTSAGDAIVGTKLAPEGEGWRVALDKPLVRLFEVSDGYLAAGLLGGDVRVINVESGEVVLERRIGGAQSVVNGAMIDGILLVQNVMVRNGHGYPQLTAVDVATGDQLWQREDVRALARRDEKLHIIGGRLPVVVEGTPGARAGARNIPLALAMLDIRTGQNSGREVEIPADDPRAQMSAEIGVWSNAIVVHMPGAIHAFSTTREP